MNFSGTLKKNCLIILGILLTTSLASLLVLTTVNNSLFNPSFYKQVVQETEISPLEFQKEFGTTPEAVPEKLSQMLSQDPELTPLVQYLDTGFWAAIVGTIAFAALIFLLAGITNGIRRVGKSFLSTGIITIAFSFIARWFASQKISEMLSETPSPLLKPLALKGIELFFGKLFWNAIIVIILSVLLLVAAYFLKKRKKEREEAKQKEAAVSGSSMPVYPK